jgi:spore germination protein
VILHTVLPGETLFSVASRYGVPAPNLAADNGILTPERLPVGMILLVKEPLRTHTVSPGETLYGIARRYGVPLRSLWRSNLFLKGGTDLQPGDVLYLEVKKEPLGTYPIGGYVYPFVKQPVLEQTLPLISGIMPFTYGFRPDGSLIPVEDGFIIDAAFRYSVSPVLHLSTLTENGNFSTALAESLLGNPAAQQVLTENLLAELRRKSYYGLDVDFEFLGAKTPPLTRNSFPACGRE